jgi:hypothetical protein
VSDQPVGLPIEEFINALSSQLDRAQAAMALKARAGLPLTFAVKDISLDLRAHVEMSGSVVRIRPAEPNESEASILRLSLTTITRPMIEENTRQMSTEVDEQSLEDALGEEISEEERRRLEWAGIHTVAQLRDIQQRTGERAIERVAQIPVLRLRQALEHASRPRVNRVQAERATDGTPMLRIRGHNLVREGQSTVRIGNQLLPMLHASEKELVVSPLAHQLSGTLVVETLPGAITEACFGEQ